MKNIFLFVAALLLVAIVGAIVLFAYSMSRRSLPNGYSVVYANADECYVIDEDSFVVVSPNVVEWQKAGLGIVVGKLSSGVEFTLDTNIGMTEYSNGNVGGNTAKLVAQLPNGYELIVNGNENMIINSNGFLVIEPNIASYEIRKTKVIGVLETGKTFLLDTDTGSCEYDVEYNSDQ